MIPRDLPSVWRARADELAPYAPPAAEAFRVAALELEEAIREGADEELTLRAAAEESGYSERALRGMLADGVIPQAGRKGAPRIRRADLPRKGRRPRAPGAYDARAHAAALLNGGDRR